MLPSASSLSLLSLLWLEAAATAVMVSSRLEKGSIQGVVRTHNATTAALERSSPVCRSRAFAIQRRRAGNDRTRSSWRSTPITTNVTTANHCDNKNDYSKSRDSSNDDKYDFGGGKLFCC